MMTTATLSPQERFVEAFAETDRKLTARQPEAIGRLRRQGIDSFARLGFPSTRMEEWRVTNVGPIARTQFELAADSNGVPESALAPYAYAGCSRLVLVNGRYSAALSDVSDLPEGVFVGSLADALERMPERVEPYLGRRVSAENHAFVALNTAYIEDGAFVHVPRGVVVERPINLVLLGKPGSSPAAFFPRNLVVAEENSQVTLIEQYASIGDGVYFTCPVTEIEAEANAVVDHYKLQRESTDAFHIATLQAYLSRSSTVSSHSLSWGGGIVRNDVNAVLDGEGAEATLNGLYMVEGDQLVDNHMRVEHAAANCDSHELYKGILEGRARAVFSGRIYVHKGAQKTDAKQTNRNLLLSKDARANSNPQLEIFADDVKCTHGSTVGQLDETAIFYLRSRGIGESAARSLLTYAFAADIVGRIKVSAVKADLEEFLFRRLPRGEIVRQAV